MNPRAEATLAVLPRIVDRNPSLYTASERLETELGIVSESFDHIFVHPVERVAFKEFLGKVPVIEDDDGLDPIF